MGTSGGRGCGIRTGVEGRSARGRDESLVGIRGWLAECCTGSVWVEYCPFGGLCSLLGFLGDGPTLYTSLSWDLATGSCCLLDTFPEKKNTISRKPDKAHLLWANVYNYLMMKHVHLPRSFIALWLGCCWDPCWDPCWSWLPAKNTNFIEHCIQNYMVGKSC